MSNGDIGSEADVYTTRYEVGSHDSLCFTIVRAVSAVTGDDPTTVEPLYETIDPDALDAVIQSFRRSEGDRGRCTVEFTLHECRVTVRANGTIELRPPSEVEDRTRPDEQSE